MENDINLDMLIVGNVLKKRKPTPNHYLSNVLEKKNKNSN